jgi:hypothetical protein
MLSPLQQVLQVLHRESKNGVITTALAEELLQTLEIKLINEYDRTNRRSEGTVKQIPQNQATVTGMDDSSNSEDADDGITERYRGRITAH